MKSSSPFVSSNELDAYILKDEEPIVETTKVVGFWDFANDAQEDELFLDNFLLEDTRVDKTKIHRFSSNISAYNNLGAENNFQRWKSDGKEKQRGQFLKNRA